MIIQLVDMEELKYENKRLKEQLAKVKLIRKVFLSTAISINNKEMRKLNDFRK